MSKMERDIVTSGLVIEQGSETSPSAALTAQELGFVQNIWDAVRGSRAAKAIAGALLVPLTASACGVASGVTNNSSPSGSPTSTSGEQTPGTRSVSPSETTSSPSSTTSPTSIPSVSSSSPAPVSPSEKPSSQNTSPTTGASGEKPPLGVELSYMGKDMKGSARLPWETKDRGFELAEKLAVKSIPGEDTEKRIFDEFFRKSSEMANIGSGMTKKDLAAYPQIANQEADLGMVAQSDSLALTGKDPATLEQSQLAWLTAMNDIGKVMQGSVAKITLNYEPNTYWGDTKPYLNNFTATMTHCQAGTGSKKSCEFTVTVWSDYEVKQNGPSAKVTRKLKVDAFLSNGTWDFRTEFLDTKG